MNALESQLDYVFGEQLPEPGAVIEVAPGVRWLRMVLPFALNHINLWLLRDQVDTPQGLREGWTVIDCGIATEATRQAWETVFANELDGLPILRVLVTHCHPDHVGLADWLCRRWQAPLLMSTGEYAFARVMSAALPGAEGTAATPHFRRHGLVDPEVVATLQGRNSYYQELVPAVPVAYVRLQDGDSIRIGGHDWEIITGFGHSPEHVSLHARSLGVLISGDMVLPRISTNVSVFAIEPEADPVRLYLESLRKYAHVAADILVLGSHGKPFRGLHTRIAQLEEHHRLRLGEVLEACATPKTGVDILPVLFKRALDTHQLSFALGESVAHLHMLWYQGKLRRSLDADGVYRFVAV
ncbi:MBL fold metallo-hydrolase [Herbaspirillum sp. alder98]|uniref:MBL fold metallo-hydrolase n=1 Tax=Herbaspirillum sp. alder98 TaxID=2913096 RepID=UPI001CD8E1C8|nr:MBL fold metallo-hydrolase [Herbaspirillum sp. alder98]MCA1326472.1 MBL fold metallo-hydrolase [Herbaspirillum sp. alder98]